MSHIYTVPYTPVQSASYSPKNMGTFFGLEADSDFKICLQTGFGADLESMSWTWSGLLVRFFRLCPSPPQTTNSLCCQMPIESA